MARASIPVDLFNPGQVFACLGFLEAADILRGGAAGGFDWENEAKTSFVLGADGDDNPFAAVLKFLIDEAKVASLAPADSGNDTKKFDIDTVRLPAGSSFPFPDPGSPATLPARLTADGREIVIAHWGDGGNIRDNVKFWAGAGGYPGAGLVRDARDLIKNTLKEQSPDYVDAAADPFAISVVQSSSPRLDWRRDYIPIDAGFSPNSHDAIRMLGFPIVELLGMIGLMHARPQPKKKDKLSYRYGVVSPGGSQLLSPVFLRAALGASPLPFPRRNFRMTLGWPGQENQARCILDVDEEIDA